MAKRENDLGRDPVGKLLLRLAIPTVTAQLVNALYNIVDRIYIGHIPEVGDLALTGLGVCFPVILFVSAISALVGMGGSSRAVVHMGEGKMELANSILGSCTTLLVVLGAAAMAAFLVFQEPMLYLFGATEETIGYAMDYLTIYLYGSIFVEISLGLNYFITAQGFSTMGMATVLIGAVINIVLDPVFIFGFGMGVKGAALATITAQGVSAVWVVWFLLGKRTRLRLQRQYLRPSWRVLAPVLALGVSPFIMQSTESLINIAFNSSLKAYGGNPAVGAMTICSSIMQVFSLLSQGLSQGAQPIIGFNYGSGQLERVKKTFRLLFITSVIYSCATFAALQLFPGLFVSLFNDKPELVEISVWALRLGPARLCRRPVHAGRPVLLPAGLRGPGPDPHLSVSGPAAQGDPPHPADLPPAPVFCRQGAGRVPGRAGGRRAGLRHHGRPVFLALPQDSGAPAAGAGPD